MNETSRKVFQSFHNFSLVFSSSENIVNVLVYMTLIAWSVAYCHFGFGELYAGILFDAGA